MLPLTPAAQQARVCEVSAHLLAAGPASLGVADMVGSRSVEAISRTVVSVGIDRFVAGRLMAAEYTRSILNLRPICRHVQGRKRDRDDDRGRHEKKVLDWRTQIERERQAIGAPIWEEWRGRAAETRRCSAFWSFTLPQCLQVGRTVPSKDPGPVVMQMGQWHPFNIVLKASLFRVTLFLLLMSPPCFPLNCAGHNTGGEDC